MPLRPPSGNDSTLGRGHISVYHRDLDTVDYANRIHTNLAVLKAIVHSLQRRAFEDPDSIGKGYAVVGDIMPILLRIPDVAHAPYSHYVFTERENPRPGYKSPSPLSSFRTRIPSPPSYTN